MSDFSGATEDAAAAAIVNQTATPPAGTPAAAAAATDAAKAPAADAQAAATAAAAAKAQDEIAAAAAAKTEAEAAAKAQADADNRYQYNPTGDAGLDIALEFIGNLGFAADNPAVVAASSGDFSKMEAAMQALGEKAKGYDRYLSLAKAAFAARTKAIADQTAASEQAVYTAVGGKDEWDKIAAFTKANADEAEKVQIEAAMKAGGMQAAAMARLLQGAYQRANPSTPRVVKAGASGAATAATGKMSLQDYTAAVKAIRAKTRGPIDNLPEYLNLRKQFASQG